jgi:hypothetical protein
MYFRQLTRGVHQSSLQLGRVLAYTKAPLTEQVHELVGFLGQAGTT